MRNIRLFQSGSYQAQEKIFLNENAAHHAVVVLRLKPGSNITLFNGNNEEFYAIIVDVDKKNVQVNITKKRRINRESPCKIHLGQAIIKGDRMEWLIQKAVELGVHQITPLLCDHAAVHFDEKRLAKKMTQWRRIIISACEQCGRNYLPILNPALPTHDWFSSLQYPHPLLLSPGSRKRINQLPSPIEHSITVATGPEGGWSGEEENIAITHDWSAISLGKRILRSETAALCTLTLLQGSFGDI